MSVAAAPDISSPSAEPQSLAQGLYERHQKRILGFCIRRLRCREEAEDAVQTTFLHALRALQRGVVPVSETAWLFKIAENVCLATHRSNGRRRAREVAAADEPEHRAGEHDLGRDERRELLRALATISQNQRQALLLREWRGLSYREISAHLGVSVGAVETLIFRARKSMARALSETGVRGRLAGVFNAGAAGNALKAALGGGATAAKLAAALAVVTIASLPAGDSPSRAGEPTARPSPAARASAIKVALEAGTEARPEPTARSGRRPSKSRAGMARTSSGHGPAARPAAAHAPRGSSPAKASSSGRAQETPPAPANAVMEPPVPPPVNLPSLPNVPTPPSPALPEAPSVPELPLELPDASLPTTPVLPSQ